jgi:hypothetical protein
MKKGNMSKLKIIKEDLSWEEFEKQWDEGARHAAEMHPIKKLSRLPAMVGITPDTARHLRWKSFKWMLLKDHQREVLRGFLKHPLRYGSAFLKSLFRKNSFLREGDFFFYGVKNVEDFKQLLSKEQTILVLGFSYCHKPFECPSGRFTSECIHARENPVCRQCFIGKAVHALPKVDAIPLFIPTVHYIGGKIFEILHAHPTKKLLFIITACEMTLRMFADWGNMAKIQGIGVRLDGRICNTMKAFELSEKGIKPGLTVVLDDTQKQILNLLRYRQETYSPS